MKAQDAIKAALNRAHGMMNLYLKDFSDNDILMRPAPAANHIAWQLGHLIGVENRSANSMKPNSGIKLPEKFEERHSKDTASVNDPSAFFKVSEYVKLFDEVRAATIANIESFNEQDLDAPGPERLRAMAPTVGDALVLMAIHQTAHAGQFVVVRRLLGKPVLF